MCRSFWTPTFYLSTLGKTRLISPVIPPLQGLPSTAVDYHLTSGSCQPAVTTNGPGLLEGLCLLPPTSRPFPCAPPLDCKRDAAVVSGTTLLEDVNMKVSLGWEP